MTIRLADKKDYFQLAEMKWLHCEEDDIDYGEHNLEGANKQKFIEEFVDFLNTKKDYKIFVAEHNGIVVSAMFVYMIPKIPRPNGSSKCIAYLTNVFTRKEYRNKNMGTELLSHIKKYLSDNNCELIFVWPSDNSVKWYSKNGFYQENEIFECDLAKE